MISPNRQQQVPELEATARLMSISPRISPIDWKLRYEAIQLHYEAELERVRLHYQHELKEKVAEVKLILKRDYEKQFAEYRTRLREEQQQLLNLSTSSLGLDHSIGEKVREQLRVAQEQDRCDEERREILLQQSTDNSELQRLINKLHTEGVHVLTLSELLALRLNGININATEDSIRSLQKLEEENTHLRSLIASMSAQEPSNKLIKCLSDIFRCEQERRLIQSQRHPNFTQLEQEIHEMCNYQRDALGRVFSEDRLSLINELEHTKEELTYLRAKIERLKQTQNYSTPNKFYLKYLRSENYRKALAYQKRYLLVLLTGYEDTETYALNEVRRLTGDTKPFFNHLYPYSYDKMTYVHKQPSRRRFFDYRFRFRCYVRVVIGVIRMRWLVKKWMQKILDMK